MVVNDAFGITVNCSSSSRISFSLFIFNYDVLKILMLKYVHANAIFVIFSHYFSVEYMSLEIGALLITVLEKEEDENDENIFRVMCPQS